MTRLDELFGTRASVVRDAVGSEVAAAVRARLVYTRYALVDRGSYEVAEPHEPELVAAITAIAAEVTGRVLQVVSARALRLGPGDYLLSHHDHGEPGVELVLDLSAAARAGADVHYRRNGAVWFRVESRPGALAIVPRAAGDACNHVYLSKRDPGDVVRLVVLLHDW